jgi:thymidylate synthase (FAD)
VSVFPDLDLNGASIMVLNQGFVHLERSCADDLGVVNAAKVSFLKHSTQFGDHELGVLEYMMKNHHGTPFEHNMFTFRVKAPLFIFREWHRHRAGHSYNEWSARYSELKPEFYYPEVCNVRQQIGKPGAYRYVPMLEPDAEEFLSRLRTSSVMCFHNYEMALALGVAKEQARFFLPVNIYSEMYWTCNARSLMHFLALRNEEHAMWEIQQYAKAVETLFSAIMPVTHEAFVKHGRRAP